MDYLKLENQLCFPLYALSRMMTQQYQPLLEGLNLTYPQYLVMMVLWEHETLSVNEIGNQLLLDSGTLTPLLKRLEEKMFINRTRSKSDERMVQVSLSNLGIALKDQAMSIPNSFRCSLDISDDELISFRNTVKDLLNKIKPTVNKK